MKAKNNRFHDVIRNSENTRVILDIFSIINNHNNAITTLLARYENSQTLSVFDGQSRLDELLRERADARFTGEKALQQWMKSNKDELVALEARKKEVEDIAADSEHFESFIADKLNHIDNPDKTLLNKLKHHVNALIQEIKDDFECAMMEFLADYASATNICDALNKLPRVRVADSATGLEPMYRNKALKRREANSIHSSSRYRSHYVTDPYAEWKSVQKFSPFTTSGQILIDDVNNGIIQGRVFDKDDSGEDIMNMFFSERPYRLLLRDVFGYLADAGMFTADKSKETALG